MVCKALHASPREAAQNRTRQMEGDQGNQAITPNHSELPTVSKSIGVNEGLSCWAWYPWYRWLPFQLSKGSVASQTARRRSSGSAVRIQALTFCSSFELPLITRFKCIHMHTQNQETFDLVSFYQLLLVPDRPA